MGQEERRDAQSEQAQTWPHSRRMTSILLSRQTTHTLVSSSSLALLSGTHGDAVVADEGTMAVVVVVVVAVAIGEVGRGGEEEGGGGGREKMEGWGGVIRPERLASGL